MPDLGAAEGSQVPSSPGSRDGSGAAWSLAMESDPIVAWVDETTIRCSQVDRELERRIEAFSQGARQLTPSWRNDQRRQIAQRLLEEAMMARAMDDEGIVVTDGEVEQAIEAEILDVFHSEQQFERYLVRRQLSRAQYAEWKRFKMRLERMLRSRGWREPTDDEVRTYYEGHRQSWPAADRLRALTITVRLPLDAGPDEERAALERIILLRNSVVSGGAEFTDVARAHSESADRQQGGNLGWIYRDDADLDPALARFLFALEPGQVSEPIRTRLGYQIFQMTDRRDEGLRDFDEVQEHVRAQVAHRMETAIRTMIVRELEARYDVGRWDTALGLEPEELEP